MIAAALIVLALVAPTPEPVEVFWAMPDGGTAENVTWPQTLADPAALTCGVWYQVDMYTPEDAARFTADGMLTLGEDYGSETQTGAISWRFVFGGDCVIPPVEPPVVPPVEPPADVPVVALANTGAPLLPLALFGGLITAAGVALKTVRRNR